MAILFMEGFDGYADGTEFIQDTRISVPTLASGYTFTTGRSGSGQALNSNGSSSDFTCVLPQESTDTLWFQFATQIVSGTLNSTEDFLYIYNKDGTVQGSLWITLGGNLEYRRSTTTTLGTTSSGITLGSWHYIECKVVFHDTTGSVVIKIDGVEVLNITSQDTLQSGSASASSLIFYHNDDIGNNDVYFDDIVIGDDSGTDATDLLGDCAIELLTPDGAGNYAQFTPSTGSNYQNVDEAPSTDDDTTYNSSSTAGHKDTFTCSNLTATAGSVYAVQVGYVARREAGAGRLIRGMIRTSSTDANGTGRYVPSTYGHRHDIFENDAGGTDWTISSVNSMEIGYNLET